MSNELVGLDPNQLPAHLRVDDADNEFAAGIGGGGIDAPTISLRGKEFRFRYNGEETSTRSRELQVILVRGRPHVSKRWYKGQYESGSIDMPACYSIDGAKPDPASPEIQSDRCSTCPRNQFGSKITPSGKKGKECADYKRLAVVPVLGGKINDQVCVLDLPVMSLRKMRGDRSDYQFLQEFTQALHRHKIPPYGVVTTLEFTDAEFPQVAFRVERYLSEDEFAHIKALRQAEIVEEIMAEPQAEAPGPIAEKVTPEADSSGEGDVANMLGGGAKPKPEPEPEPEQKAEPEPEAKPEQKAEPADDDVMAQVKGLLGGLS
jgi:hypothetical protein